MRTDSFILANPCRVIPKTSPRQVIKSERIATWRLSTLIPCPPMTDKISEAMVDLNFTKKNMNFRFNQTKSSDLNYKPCSFNAQCTEHFSNVVGLGCRIFNSISSHDFTHIITFHEKFVFMRFFGFVDMDDGPTNGGQSLYKKT